MSLKDTFLRGLNHIIRKGYWFNNELFPDCEKFWNYHDFNTEVINLGSTSALHAFCYDDLPVKAANWALGHNPLVADLAILKNYCSFLKPDDCTVILPLCPFSSLSGSYVYLEDRYYSILYCTSIPDYSYKRNKIIRTIKGNPLPHYPLLSFFKDLKHTIIKGKQSGLSEKQMEHDSQCWITSWMKEFSLTKLSYPLSLRNRDAIDDAAKIINEMIAYCKEINARPVILIPPMYHTLSEKFSPEVRKVIIDSLINKIEDKTVWFKNYMDDERFINDSTLFQNSYLLNKKGAKFFTAQLLKELSII